MKRKKVLFALAVIPLLLACSIFDSSSSSTTTTASSSSSANANPYVGTWIMDSEVATSGSIDIENPATHKILEIKDNQTVIEDYSQLEGLGVCNSTQGQYSGEWGYVNDVLTIDVTTSVEDVAPYIDCGADAGTTAVPRSILSFSYTGDSWEFELSNNGNTLTATMSKSGTPTLMVTQVFTRQ